ncbi:hypothetical protein [Nocardia harenae]|uniref:hypothetical protein n=1 Tax=Nocardia harenae TaxID=358707 RepID=UPI0008358B4E|nr:hypothetical protein [Nocardia harenae]
MIILIGLLVLVAAVIVGVAGTVANTGENHYLASDFTVFDYHFSGSSGLLFFDGIVLGALGMFGFVLVVGGSWFASRRAMLARRELRQSRKEVAAARKDLAATQPSVPVTATPAATTAPVQTSAPSQKPSWSWNRFLNRSGAATASK